MNPKHHSQQDVYKDEGYKFMGAAFEVYNDRGYGLAEEIYQECLEIELELRQISFQSRAELRSFYKGRELKKRYIPDLFVFDCLVVELKAVAQLAAEHEAQLLNYMRLARQPIGYLINLATRTRLNGSGSSFQSFLDERRCEDQRPKSGLNR